jgi:hypothetical protein
MIRPRAAIAFAVSLFLGVTVAHAACGDAKTICAGGSPWYEANAARVRFSASGSADFAEWQFLVPDPLDIEIRTTSSHEGKIEKGTIILVHGRMMLTRGLSLERGYEIDAIDSPVLSYQLAMTLLTQAFPKGPAELHGTHAVDLRERERSIQVATTSASGEYPPPWTLKGKVARTDSENIAFALTFTFPAEKARETLAIEGTWTKRMRPPALDPNMKLEGWNAYALGPISIKQQGGTILDYGAQARPTQLRTLGELQKSLRRSEASSNPAPQPTR